VNECPQVMSACDEYLGLLASTGKTRSRHAVARSQEGPHVSASVEACLTFHLCEKLHLKLEHEGLMCAYRGRVTAKLVLSSEL
jgi:hypothetical protein